MTGHDGYPSDLSDARWALEPVLMAWQAERHRQALAIGRPPEHDLRQIMNAILYVDCTGIPWRYLPHDSPPDGLRLLRAMGPGQRLRPAHRAAPPPGPRGRGTQQRAVVLRAGLPNHQDLRQRAPRRPGHRRRETHHRTQAPPTRHRTSPSDTQHGGRPYPTSHPSRDRQVTYLERDVSDTL